MIFNSALNAPSSNFGAEIIQTLALARWRLQKADHYDLIDFVKTLIKMGLRHRDQITEAAYEMGGEEVEDFVDMLLTQHSQPEDRYWISLPGDYFTLTADYNG